MPNFPKKEAEIAELFEQSRGAELEYRVIAINKAGSRKGSCGEAQQVIQLWRRCDEN